MIRTLAPRALKSFKIRFSARLQYQKLKSYNFKNVRARAVVNLLLDFTRLR